MTMTPTGIFVFTPYGKGEVLGTRNDGIIIVQLRTSQGKPYLGYFHLSQVRQLSSADASGGSNNQNESNEMPVDGAGAAATRKRGALDDGEQAAQRLRGQVGEAVMPFTDVLNQQGWR